MTSHDDRDQRRAAALRANLRRRKAPPPEPRPPATDPNTGPHTGNNPEDATDAGPAGDDLMR